MPDLVFRHCKPCRGDAVPLTRSEIDELRTQLPRWTLNDGRLVRELEARNFQAALDLVNGIGALAESEGHHPDLSIYSWNRIRVELYTHSIGGLSENDFILAAKIELLVAPSTASE